MFDSEIQPNLVSYLKGNDPANEPGHMDSAVSPSSNQGFVVGTVEHWLIAIGMQKYKDTFLVNGFDRLEFLVS